MHSPISHNVLTAIARGDTTPTFTTITAMARELLERRQILNIAWNTEVANEALKNARATIRSDDPILPRKLQRACKIILWHSQCPDERDAAQFIINQMNGAA